MNTTHSLTNRAKIFYYKNKQNPTKENIDGTHTRTEHKYNKFKVVKCFLIKVVTVIAASGLANTRKRL